MVKYKKCNKCDTLKEVTEFYLNQGKYYSYQCKICVNKRIKDKREKKYLNPIDLEGEIWRRVYENEKYQISNLGRIKSFTRRKIGTILNLRFDFYGYVSYNLVGNNKSSFAHRMVAKSFIPNPENKPYVNHINGNKSDNRVENLEWCTNSENQIHAHKTGLKISLKGESHNSAKLKEIDILKIRNEYEMIDKINDIRLFLNSKSIEYSVTDITIKLIITRKTWRHI